MGNSFFIARVVLCRDGSHFFRLNFSDGINERALAVSESSLIVSIAGFKTSSSFFALSGVEENVASAMIFLLFFAITLYELSYPGVTVVVNSLSPVFESTKGFSLPSFRSLTVNLRSLNFTSDTGGILKRIFDVFPDSNRLDDKTQ